MLKQLGNYLRQRRFEQGITQQELAKKVGVRSQLVSNWERGKCVPPAHVLKRMIQVQKIDPQELVAFMFTDCVRL